MEFSFKLLQEKMNLIHTPFETKLMRYGSSGEIFEFVRRSVKASWEQCKKHLSKTSKQTGLTVFTSQ